MNRSSRSLAWPRAASAAAVVLLAALLGTGSARAIQIDWVTVGDLNNAPDTSVTNLLGDSFGSVGYYYDIMKFEVTNLQYVQYLNAVDPQGVGGSGFIGDEPMVMGGIYRTVMNGTKVGVVFTSGAANGSKYSVKTAAAGFSGSYADKPVGFISWFMAARFANWVNNGSQTYQFSSPNVPGYDGISLTGSAAIEDGAYTIPAGAMDGQPPARNPGAKVWIPLYDEWYKAAYYDPTLNDGAGGYWGYATQNDTPPTLVDFANNGDGQVGSETPFTGNGVSAQTVGTGWSNPGGTSFRSIGTSGTSSYYGTFDQSGNATEMLGNASEDFFGVVFRVTGGMDNAGGLPKGGLQMVTPGDTNGTRYGFRLASVPEPSTWLLGVSGLALGAWAAGRRRRRPGR